ncbi:LysR family transcriptional regulator [Lacibacterium aquatile]|uniref:LysR family transcriptional regulator n=1 Tax=Lacibacterium aquatile TaxID=1168082 RepID=A0ABW5DTW3_9PROT
MKTLAPDWYLRVRLKLRHLQLFVALDDYRNLNRAAGSLNMSQPAASKLLGELEEMLGIELFERQPRGVEPNWYGEVMIRHARTVLANLGQAGDELMALKTGDGGSASIGTVMAPAVDAVVDAVEAVRRDLPRLHITVQVETSDVLVPRLVDSKLDFVVARIPQDVDPNPFIYEEVSDEEICFVVSDQHPLAEKAGIRLVDLIDRSWVIQPRTSILRRRVDGMFQSAGLPIPAKVTNTPSVFMALATVAKTEAITVMAKTVAQLFAAPGRFRILDFERFSVQPFGLIRLRDKPLSPGAAALFKKVRGTLLPG